MELTVAKLFVDYVMFIWKPGTIFSSNARYRKKCGKTTLYALWRERNQRRHGEAATPSSHLIRKVDKRIRNWFAIFRRLFGHAYERGLVRWPET
uniref:Uncharacterized protein n=1 Tax=Brassica oleracea TaxID=3712 RepID=A0A3P6FTX8_BRAOL|nr:unnamed protein product [Brassica oleracea]